MLLKAELSKEDKKFLEKLRSSRIEP
jgi:hypothetical protein